MKVLEITFQSPGTRNGGELGIYQSIRSLASNCDVDYIGPEFDYELFKNSKYKVNIIKVLRQSKSSIFKRMWYFITSMASTSFYEDWLVAKKDIVWSDYDVVHIEFSRYMFVVKESKKHNKKVIVRVHNIESDYAYNIFSKQKNISNWFRYFSFYKNEKKIVKKVDRLVFLTETDIKHSEKLYGKTNNEFLNPVCIESNEIINDIQNLNNDTYNVLLTGSLNYGPNIEGVLWFLDNVWDLFIKSYSKNIHLTIAGAHPNEKLKRTASRFKNVNIIDTPDSMRDYFLNADVYIAAVFNGAGMKVKVAEALSFGVPVIGTSHSFIGYERIERGVYLADTADVFISWLHKLANRKTSLEEKEAIKQDFDAKLSIKSSIERYKLLLNALVD